MNGIAGDAAENERRDHDSPARRAVRDARCRRRAVDRADWERNGRAQEMNPGRHSLRIVRNISLP